MRSPTNFGIWPTLIAPGNYPAAVKVESALENKGSKVILLENTSPASTNSGRDPVIEIRALFVVALVFLLGVTLYAKDDPASGQTHRPVRAREKDVKLEWWMGRLWSAR